MNCKNCGLELPADAAFCLSCGTKVEAQTKTIETLMLAPSILAEVGNFFIKGNYAYFLTHGFCFGAHSKLWRMDLKTKQSVCLIDYDAFGVSLLSETFCQQADYPLLYADEHIISAVINNKDEREFLCYSLRENRLMELGALDLPPYISLDGRYFYHVRDNADGIEIQYKTIAKAFRGEATATCLVNASTAPNLYAQLPDASPSTDITIYQDMILTRVFASQEILFVALPLSNPNRGYRIGNQLSASPELFAYDDEVLLYDELNSQYIVYDLREQETVANIPAENDMHIMQYRSSLYFTNNQKALLFDCCSNNTFTPAKNAKVFVSNLKNDIYCTNEGAYYYRYQDSVTELFYLERNELFSASTETEDDICVKPFVRCDFHREVVPSLRDRAKDANIYTIENTKELSSCMQEYQAKNGNSFRIPFRGRNYVTLPDGTMIGFCFGHPDKSETSTAFSYNLYLVDERGNPEFLNAGASGGIETLAVYKNFVYWDYANTVYRYDFNDGSFTNSDTDAGIQSAYQTICDKATKTYL